MLNVNYYIYREKYINCVIILHHSQSHLLAWDSWLICLLAKASLLFLSMSSLVQEDLVLWQGWRCVEELEVELVVGVGDVRALG